jgi:MinD-like ATPase involved in chromosome partitioning or flagellar assembly
VLVRHILLERDEVVVMDMEAGIEHLARGTAAAMDKLIVVVEPGRRSVDTAKNIKKLAGEIGVQHICLVGNKIREEEDRVFLEKYASGFEWLGFIPYDQDIIRADLTGISPYETRAKAKDIVQEMVVSIVDEVSQKGPHSHTHKHVHNHEHTHGNVAHSHNHFHSHNHSHSHHYSFLEGHEHDHHGDDHTHDDNHGPHDHRHDGND